VDGVSLFHVRGVDQYDTRAVQVEERASALNGGDCFVLLTPKVMYVWKGAGANDDEQATALSIAKSLQESRSLQEVKEGAEPEAFWSALGGKAEYPKVRAQAEAEMDPMLYLCSNATGRFEMEAVFDFSQADLEEEDVYLLDSHTSIFVWIGKQANDEEKKLALETAQVYLSKQGYPPDTPIVTVPSGSEPNIFTCHFLGWDSSRTKAFIDPYQAKLDAIKASNEVIVVDNKLPTPPPPVMEKYEDGANYTLNYEELRNKTNDQLPKGVDPKKKETYLSDADFERVLGSPRGEFTKMKAWKQSQLKKVAGLF